MSILNLSPFLYSKKKLYLFMGILLTLFNCTGFNIFATYNPYINTNPTPEYSHVYAMVLKGGYVFHLNSLPGGIGVNAKTTRIGTSCSHSFLYLVSLGDSSIDSIKLEAKIEKISSINYEQMGILSFVYHRFCTTITGE